MYVAHNRDRGLNMNHIALFHEQLLRLSTNSLDNRLGKQLFPIEPLDALIQIDTSYPINTLALIENSQARKYCGLCTALKITYLEDQAL